jgi:VanZ family protein
MPVSPSVPRRPAATIRLWAPVLVYAVGIFLASTVHQPPGLPVGFTDKEAHGLLYAGFAVVALRALAGGRLAGVTFRTALLAVVVAAAYGATDEFHQSFVAGRTADVADWGADASGALLGCGLVYAIGRLGQTPPEARI